MPYDPVTLGYIKMCTQEHKTQTKVFMAALLTVTKLEIT